MTSTERAWRTSSYFGTQGGNCVEVAARGRMVMGRDIKDHCSGLVQAVSADGRPAFVGRVQGGTFGLGESDRLL